MEIKCDYCGENFNYKGGNVHYNRSKKHYCSTVCLNKSNTIHGLASKKKNGGHQARRYQMFMGAKKRAKQKNLFIDLKIEDIPKIPERCPILNIKLIKTNKILGDNSPSLDRIIPKLGYTKNNIRIISNRANIIKRDMTMKEAKKILKDLEEIYEKF